MGDHVALQTLSEATPTGTIHWPDVFQKAARAVWQHTVEIDDCPRQNSAYRLAHILYFTEFQYIGFKNSRAKIA